MNDADRLSRAAKDIEVRHAGGVSGVSVSNGTVVTRAKDAVMAERLKRQYTGGYNDFDVVIASSRARGILTVAATG